MSDATEKSWVPRDRVKRAPDYAGAIIGSVIALVAINAYPLWQPLTDGVVTEEWPRILWAADLSLVAQICGSLIFLFWRLRWLRNLFELVFTASDSSCFPGARIEGTRGGSAGRCRLRFVRR